MKLGAVAVGMVIAVVCDASGLPHAEFADKLISAFHRSFKDGNTKQLDPKRRLATPSGTAPAVNYQSVCTGACWTAIQTEFVEALVVLNGDTCKDLSKQRASVAAVAALDGPTTTTVTTLDTHYIVDKGDFTPWTNDCVFDMCDDAQTTEICAFEANYTSIAGNFDVDDCQASYLKLICNSVCSSTCTSDSDAKTLMCGNDGDQGASSTQSTGADLAKQFNLMCSYNDAKQAFCYDLIAGYIGADAFLLGQDETTYPDPCTDSCTTTSGYAIEDMGCCFPVLMSAASSFGLLTTGSMRTAQATADYCATTWSSTPFATCSSSTTYNGSITTTGNMQKSIEMPVTCDSVSTDEAAITTSISNNLNAIAPCQVKILTCRYTGNTCGRRLTDEGRFLASMMLDVGMSSTVELDISTAGIDAATDLTSLTTVLSDPAWLKNLVTQATLATTYGTYNGTTTVTTTTTAASANATTIAAAAGQISSSRPVHASHKIMVALVVAVVCLAR